MYYVMCNGVKPDIYQIPSTVIDTTAVSRSELTERIKFQAPHWLRNNFAHKYLPVFLK